MASEALKNNPALRKLLGYLADASLGGQPDALKEYSIGREVMGKPPDYDPRTDSSVRVQIGKLRLKLEDYYAREASSAQFRLELPKGRFEIVLTRMPPASPPPVRNPWKVIALAASALCLILAGVLAVLVVRPPRPPAPSPEVSEFWGPFLDTDKPLMIALGVPFFIRFGPVFFRNPYVNDMQTARDSIDLEALGKAVRIPRAAQESRRFSGLGEASALFEITRLVAAHRPDVLLKRASVLDWEDLRTNNMVIIGPPKFAPQTRDLPIVQDFVFEGTSIVNLKPRSGEQSRFHKSRGDDPEVIDEDFGLVTYAAGRSGWGDLIILASSSTEATWAAAEAVTRPHHLSRILPKLRPSGQPMPKTWQMIVRAKFKNQVPIDITYVTHHTLSDR
jgi:hypothetical protein